ncbi:MAG: hypothetical protein DRJ42_29340 [Deltaproteobacteria bacterium]|nr:MAG: hypothetical protein DRJ42_29340 [Deltaproteobacteria bacterium]
MLESKLSRSALALALSLSLNACYSMVEYRASWQIRTEGRPDWIYVEVWNPIGPLNDPLFQGHAIVTAIALYPIDAVVNLFTSIGIAADSERRIRWGPIGAALSIVTPGVTLFVGLGRAGIHHFDPFVIEPDEFDRLHAGLDKQGAAYRVARVLGIPRREIKSFEYVYRLRPTTPP